MREKAGFLALNSVVIIHEAGLLCAQGSPRVLFLATQMDLHRSFCRFQRRNRTLQLFQLLLRVRLLNRTVYSFLYTKIYFNHSTIRANHERSQSNSNVAPIKKIGANFVEWSKSFMQPTETHLLLSVKALAIL